MLVILLLLSLLSSAQEGGEKVLKVHFLYGSKPRKAFRESEEKYFGGIHGGHVTIEVDGMIFGFSPKDGFHYISHYRHRLSSFSERECKEWSKDTASRKYTSIIIPISLDDYLKLKSIRENYLKNTPYDYAFLGMRCAAATADVLSQISIGKKRSKAGLVLHNFFPQPLRRRMLYLASIKKYTVVKHEGRVSRKWENE